MCSLSALSVVGLRSAQCNGHLEMMYILVENMKLLSIICTFTICVIKTSAHILIMCKGSSLINWSHICYQRGKSYMMQRQSSTRVNCPGVIWVADWAVNFKGATQLFRYLHLACALRTVIINIANKVHIIK